MFRILGWILAAFALLLTFGAVAELYALEQIAADSGGGFSFSAFLNRVSAPSLTVLCAMLLALLARRFLIRARHRAARRAHRSDVEQMTDLFS